MKPTDHQIEQAVAKVLGWSKCQDEKGRWHIRMPNGKLHYVFGSRYEEDADYWLPILSGRYCTDRNLLPQLVNHIKAKSSDGSCFAMAYELDVYGDDETHYWPVMRMLELQPRAHCIAFLKALNALPEAWEDENEVE